MFPIHEPITNTIIATNMEPNGQRHKTHLLLLFPSRLLSQKQHDRQHKPKRHPKPSRPTRLHPKSNSDAPTRRPSTRRIRLLTYHIINTVFHIINSANLSCSSPPRCHSFRRRYRWYSGSRCSGASTGMRTFLVRRAPSHAETFLELPIFALATFRCSGELGKQHTTSQHSRGSFVPTPTILRRRSWVRARRSAQALGVRTAKA